jgi:hypothetical protein
MKMSWKAVLTALLVFGGATAVSGCASAQGYGYYGDGYYDNGYAYGAPDGGVGFSYDSGGYCDAYGCPNDYWDMPVYYGSVYYGDSWFNGPVYYRDWNGRRQYWIRGGWRYDQWRGARPSWYREGRYGPALGLNFYRDHGFRGRGDNDRGFDNRRDNRQFDNRRFDNRQRDDRQGRDRQFDNRRFDNNRPSGNQFREPRQTVSPQASPADQMRGIGNAFGNRSDNSRRFENRNDNGGRNFGNRDGGRRDAGGRGDRGGDRSNR